MANNVVIKRMVQAYNIDAYNRTAVCDEDLENGSVFKLEEYSDTEGEEMVWKVKKPTAAADKGVWMATSPEVVIIKDAMGNEYKGLTPDPRAFVNIAGKMIDATYLAKGDLIEMTAEGISDADTNNYLVIGASGGYKLESASAAGDGFALKKVGTSRLHIGDGGLVKKFPVTYIYECENN